MTIKNGIVRGFDFGVAAGPGNKVVVDNVVASANGRAGILLTGYTTKVPTGKNIARANDNPNECDPTNLC